MRVRPPAPLLRHHYRWHEGDWRHDEYELHEEDPRIRRGIFLATHTLIALLTDNNHAPIGVEDQITFTVAG